MDYIIKKKIKKGDCRDISLYDEGKVVNINLQTYLITSGVDSYFFHSGACFVLNDTKELVFIPVE